MTTLDRRDFLRAAGAAALGAFPPSIRRALAIPANNATGSIMDIEHVVILMQENRSFDHYFGTMPGVRGFADRFTIPQPEQASVFAQSDGTRVVMSLRGSGQGQRPGRRRTARLGRLAQRLGQRPHDPLAAVQDAAVDGVSQAEGP